MSKLIAIKTSDGETEANALVDKYLEEEIFEFLHKKVCVDKERQTFRTWIGLSNDPSPSAGVFIVPKDSYETFGDILNRVWESSERRKQHVKYQNVSEFPVNMGHL